MGNYVELSSKHRLNPTLLKCFCCGKDVAIALIGRIGKEDSEAPTEATAKKYIL